MRNVNVWRIALLILIYFGLSLYQPNQTTYAQLGTPELTSCNNLLQNGDMESDHSWQLSSGGIAASYVNNAFAGFQAMRVGPPEDLPLERNVQSTAWQVVRIPASAPSTLSFWYRPETDRNPGSDRQYIGLINTDGSVVELFVNELSSKDAWQFYSVDVTRYAGRTLWVYFARSMFVVV